MTRKRGLFGRTNQSVLLFTGMCWLTAQVFLVDALAQSTSQGAPMWISDKPLHSEDGFADLEWQSAVDEGVEFYRLNEVFNGEDRYSYIAGKQVRLHRSEPGQYSFTLQACQRQGDGLPVCGAGSDLLSLQVTESVRDEFAQGSIADLSHSSTALPASIAVGGPEKLRPGLWYNPQQDGHGYSFYWTNNLSARDADQVQAFGYDLHGIWFTYEAKTGFYQGSDLVFADYLPVAARLKLVHEGENRYSGGLFITRNGEEILEGSVTVIFAADNTNAVVDWSADFKLQRLSGVEPVENLAGSNPDDENNATHYSGTWVDPDNDSYQVIDTVGAVSEAIEILFPGAAGDTTWVQGANEGTASADSTSICFHYIESGYAPGSIGAVRYTDIACDYLSKATYFNRNGSRQFSEFERLSFWANISLPFARGEISIGSLEAPQVLRKASNFHRIFFSEPVDSCDLVDGPCRLKLNWFTDGDYPRISVFRQDLDSLQRTLITPPGAMAAENHEVVLQKEGRYKYELRMGPAPDAALMAETAEVLVTRSEPPEIKPANPDSPPSPASRPSFSIAHDSVTAGAVQGAFSVDEQGAANYRIALASAPGSGGFAPELSLQYNSHGANGAAGVGWSIGGQSSITRCPQTREQDGIKTNHSVSLDWSDRYCLDGQRLVVINGEYGADGTEYRFELDDHSKVFSRGEAGKGPATFEVWHGDGSVSYYGASTDSRIEARIPGDSATVMTWAINRRQDGAGNYILYEYDENTSGAVEVTLKAVRYTGNTRAGTAPYAEFLFHYSQGRNDIPDSHFLGGLIRHKRLLTRIDSRARTRASDTSMAFLRSYNLGYGQDGFGRKVLESLKECSSDSKKYCYEPTRFNWLKTENHIGSAGIPAGGVLPKKFSGLSMADVNGDGYLDLLISEGKKTFSFKVAFAQKDGSFRLNSASYPIPATKDRKRPVQLVVMDINADGFQDVIYPKRGVDSIDWVARLANQAGFGPETVVAEGCCDYLEPKVASVLDYNGDGLADLLTHTGEDPSSWRGNLVVLLNSGVRSSDPAFLSPVKLLLEYSEGLFPQNEAGPWFPKQGAIGFTEVIAKTPVGAQAFDYNGDGNVDLLARVDQKYVHCEINCQIMVSEEIHSSESLDETGNLDFLPPGGGEDEHTIGFYIVFESDGAGRYTQSEVVAADASLGCEVPVACDPWPSMPLVKQILPVDLNGDGLADLAYLDDAGLWLYRLNSGAGFAAPQKIVRLTDMEIAQLARFADISGDGYPEFLYPEKLSENDTEWIVHANDLGSGFGAAEMPGIVHGNSTEGDISVLLDFNGDGMTDNLLIDFRNGRLMEPGSQLYQGVNLVDDAPHEAVNQIGEIIDGLGKRVLIRYGSLTQAAIYTRLESAKGAEWGRGSAVFDLLAPVNVVRSVSSSSPNHNDPNAMTSSEYHYVGARIQAGGRGFLGFAEIVQWNSADGIRTHARFRQDFPYIGLSYETLTELASYEDRWSSLGGLLKDRLASWPAINPISSTPGDTLSGSAIHYAASQWTAVETSEGTGAWQRVRSANSEANWAPDGGQITRKTTETTLDEFGRPARTIEKLWGADSREADLTITSESDYFDPNGTWNLGLVQRVTVSHKRPGRPEILRRSSFEYDSRTGIKTRETTSPDNDEFRVVSSYQNDLFGNRTATTVSAADVPARSSILKFDGLGRFAIAEYNHYGQQVSRISNWNQFGTALEVRDIDGVVTQSASDAMGRVFANWNATGSWDRTVFQRGAGVDCPQGTVLHSRTNRGGQPAMLSCLDLLNREIRIAQEGFDGRWIFSDTAYDSRGRVSRISEPYFESNARYWNITFFDAIGRVIRVDSSGGDDLWLVYGASASGFCGIDVPSVIETTNALGQKQVEVKNAMGETLELYDDHCGRVSYQYDSIGNLLQVVGADRARTRMSYDAAGRKLSTSDPDKGLWQYAWNALGEMTRQLDAKRQAIDYQYDSMGRVTLRLELSEVDSIDDGIYEVEHRERTRWQNASAPEVRGKGQPLSITYESASTGSVLHGKSFLYDRFGRVSSVMVDLDGHRFVEDKTYDQFGRKFQEFDASGDYRGLRYRYNPHGYLDQLAESRDGMTANVYRDIEDMDARGNVTYAVLGNDVELFATFEASSGQLLGQQAYGSDGSELQDTGYFFDVLGNLRQRSDHSGNRGLAEDFSYDSLNRLVRVELIAPNQNIFSPTETLALEYDASGNITWKSGVGNYRYGEGAAGPHAVTFAGGQVYTYDANGNQLSGKGRTISYSLFDKATRIEKEGLFTEFAYGIAHKRVSRVDSNDIDGHRKTRYVGPVEYITEGTSSWYRRNMAGVAIAEFYPSSGRSSAKYIVKDHLGSVHSLTGETGRSEDTIWMSFSAFGERRSTSWNDPLNQSSTAYINALFNRGFTGHEQIDAMGLVHMNGRIYDPSLGRFLQADPMVSEQGNSQGLNRYSYALNNPLSYTDPSGYFLKRLVKRWGRLIAALALSVVLPGGQGILATVFNISNVYAQAAITGFAAGAITSGSLKGAVIGALTAVAVAGVVEAYSAGKTVSGLAPPDQLLPNECTGHHLLGANEHSEGLYRIFVKGDGVVKGHELISADQVLSGDSIFTNGIRNGFDAAVKNASGHLHQAGLLGESYVLNFNPTQGVFADLLEASRDIVGAHTGWTQSHLARNMAGLIDRLSRNGVSGIQLVGHSQGGAITASALRYAAKAGLNMGSLSGGGIALHGAPVNAWMARTRLADSAGVQIISRHQFGDAIHVLGGLNLTNPLELPIAILRAPALLSSDPSLSPHSLPCGGSTSLVCAP